MARLLKDQFNSRFFDAIAHRGLHGEGVTENSLKAFSLAIENSIPFECDVHLSKDGKLVVCHDANLKRVCGKDGFIPSLTVEEIKRDYRLLDGQEVPTLEEVLTLNQERVPHVIELKVDDGNHKALAKRFLEEIKDVKDKSLFTVISFYPQALLDLKKSGFTRGLLVCKEHPFWLRVLPFFDYLDIDIALFEDKRIQKYRSKGGVVNVWTVEKDEHLTLLSKKVDMITFQHLPIEKVRDALAK